MFISVWLNPAVRMRPWRAGNTGMNAGYVVRTKGHRGCNGSNQSFVFAVKENEVSRFSDILQ